MAAPNVIIDFQGRDIGLNDLIKEVREGLIDVKAAEKSLEGALAKGTITNDKYTASIARLARKTGKGSAGGSAHLAVQELGRGIADFNAGGGFQDFSRGALGATNNIERMIEVIGFTAKKTGGFGNALRAVGSSLMGPAGLILGLTLLINLGPKLFSWFKNMTSGSTEASDALKKFREESEKTGESFEVNYLNKLDAAIKETFGEKQKLIKQFQDQIEKGFRNSVLDKTIKQIAEIEEKLAKLGSERDDLVKYMDALRQAKEIEQQLNDVLYDQLDARTALSSVLGETYGGFEDTFDDSIPKIVDPDDIDVIDEYADSVDDLNQILKENGRITGQLSIQATSAWLDAQEKFEGAKVTIEGATDSLISAFESAAVSGKNFGDALASGILGAIGSMLIKEGSAYVALGIARNAAFPGSGTKVIAGGAGLVAAGVGLKAAGASIGRSSSGGSGGGSSAGSAPGSREVDTTSSNAIEFRIGNGALIGQIQQGLDKRGTTHGTAKLFPN